METETPTPPQTFTAPEPAAPGMPNPIPAGIAWGQAITPDVITT